MMEDSEIIQTYFNFYPYKPLRSCSSSASALVDPWVPEPAEQQDWMPWIWMDRHMQFVNHTLTNGASIDVVFFGDSITEGWDYMARDIWDTQYASKGAVNYGIGGDRTEHVLWRIINGEVDNISPKLVVLKIGTNNMWFHSEVDIARGITAIVSELRGRLSTTKILLLEVLPRMNEADTIRTEAINSRVSILDNRDTVRYLNMRDAYYAGAGNFYTELYNADMLHLSNPGYAKWNETMNSLFEEMYLS